MTPAEVKQKRHTSLPAGERKMLSPEAAKRDIIQGFIDQKREGRIEIDNREPDSILIWGIPKPLGREGEEAQVVIVKREKIHDLIKLLERCQK